MPAHTENGDKAIERIRRYQMNAFDGESIAADLEACSDLWEAVWMNWDENAPDSLSLAAPDWDSASRLLEIAHYWRSDGFEANENADGGWTVSGWWD